MKVLMILSFFLLTTVGITGQHIFTNYHTAVEKATAENKLVLMVFSGSDWCKPCIILKKDILTTDQFVQFSKNNVVHLEVDFPYHKDNRLPEDQMAQNESLAERYNPSGEFPKVVLLNDDGEIIQKIAYKKGMDTASFISQIKAVL